MRRRRAASNSPASLLRRSGSSTVARFVLIRSFARGSRTSSPFGRLRLSYCFFRSFQVPTRFCVHFLEARFLPRNMARPDIQKQASVWPWLRPHPRVLQVLSLHKVRVSSHRFSGPETASLSNISENLCTITEGRCTRQTSAGCRVRNRPEPEVSIFGEFTLGAGLGEVAPSTVFVRS